MPEQEINVITGAFSYTGKYITSRLLAMGKQVRTLTAHPDNPNPFGTQVSVYPFNFGRPEALVKSLAGATTLYNTYWVRFAHGTTTFETAVANTLTLVKAAEEAGVRRIVHVSITNPSQDSPLPYFHGKAVLLRRFPVFPIFGSGGYRLQPIYVEDMVDLVIQAGQSRENFVLDAVGPDIFSFEEVVRLPASTLDRRVIITHVPPGLGFALARAIEPFVRDVLIARDEIAGLMADLLISRQMPTGTTRLEDWLRTHRSSVGRVYASELRRHYR